MANIREWLDKKYPKDQRENIKELDISDNNLEGSLKLNWFNNLEKFYCSGNKITDLDVSNCKKLEILECSRNKLNNLILGDLANLKKLDFSFNNLSNEGLSESSLKNLEELHCNNNHLTDLNYFFSSFDKDNKLTFLNIKNNNLFLYDLSNFEKFVNLRVLLIGNDEEERIERNVYNRFEGSLESLQELKKLESLNISNTDIENGLEYLENLRWIYCSYEQRPESKVKKIVECLESNSLVDEDEGKYKFKYLEYLSGKKKNDKIVYMTETKNIIIVGRTGAGKSTLANILTNTNNFTEWEHSVSKTRDIQKGEFNHEKVNYHIIDVPGIDNTKLPNKLVLMDIEEGIDSIEVSKIFLVIKDGNFTEGEKAIFKLLETSLGENPADCIAIVRTNFIGFRNLQKCKEDKEFLIAKISKIFGSFSSCEVIHVDNPSIDVSGENEEERQLNEINKKSREISRKILLDYLKDNCQGSYKLENIKVEEARNEESLKIPQEEKKEWYKECGIL